MTATRAKRKRRGVEVTLSAEALERLRALATAHPDGTMSAVVEDMVMGHEDAGQWQAGVERCWARVR